MKIGWRGLLLAALGAGAAGFAVAAIGLVNVSATSGHWAVTDWFLHWVMRNSVAFRAGSAPEPPPLDDPALIRLGAAHFESSCAFCHGSPATPFLPLPTRMTPQAPSLGHAGADWEPKELYWIILHGVKFTAMPSWIAERREDEPWALVAFLKAWPDLDAAGYRALAQGTPPADARLPTTTRFEAVVADCGRCHEADPAADAVIPVLEGQTEDYLAATLSAFASGDRESGFMQFAVSGLGDDDLAALARHYASAGRAAAAVPPAAPDAATAAASAALPATPADPERRALIERGAEIASAGVPAAGVPACASCHGEPRRNAAFPVLDGQPERYLAAQLAQFRAGGRGGTAYGHVMQTIGKRLSEEDAAAAAAYYAAR